MNKGLTLGKYAPMHRGYQLVIETALAEMDETVVVIYDAPDVTRVPLSVRAGWLRSLYPSLQAVEAYGPTRVGYTPDIMRSHERFLIDTLSLAGITHFYSSEPYGEHVSIALGAVDRRLDPARVRVPISATRIREDPHRKLGALDHRRCHWYLAVFRQGCCLRIATERCPAGSGDPGSGGMNSGARSEARPTIV